MRRLSGKQNETVKFYYNDHIYYADKRRYGIIYRCAKKNALGCIATIYLQHVNDVNNDEHIVINQHNHKGDPLYIFKYEFSEEMELQSYFSRILNKFEGRKL